MIERGYVPFHHRPLLARLVPAYTSVDMGSDTAGHCERDDRRAASVLLDVVHSVLGLLEPADDRGSDDAARDLGAGHMAAGPRAACLPPSYGALGDSADATDLALVTLHVEQARPDGYVPFHDEANQLTACCVLWV